MRQQFVLSQEDMHSAIFAYIKDRYPDLKGNLKNKLYITDFGQFASVVTAETLEEEPEDSDKTEAV